MANKKKFYVTTAIDYPNAEPHIGHAYQKIVADVLARWHKLLGKDVRFLTGLDEHGKKIAESAEKAGKTPKQFVDEMASKFKEAWKVLRVEPDRFIRTTDKDHVKLVQEIIKKTDKKGDIYLGKYKGLYCVGCERYYTEKDAEEGKCPLHNRPLEKLEEESYFFKLSKYQKFLLGLYEKKGFLLPKERKNEIKNRVKEGLKDLSISRTSFNWGIPFPLDKRHVVYVWYDALLNYYTGSGKNKEYWPADLHLLGKDNGWFHAVYWPAMLKSVGLKLPKTIFVHGFLSFNGQKISKSLGNAISPISLVDKYGSDSIRYYSMRTFPFAEGNDGDFSEKVLVERHNSELADKLGNLISRTTALAEKNGITKCENKLLKKLKLKQIDKLIENYELDKALNEIFAFIDRCNEYIQAKKPWETKDKKILYELVDSIKAIAILLSPFIPDTSEEIAKNLGFKLDINEIGKPYKVSKIKKSKILFQKLEYKEEKEKEIKKDKTEGIITMDEIQFDDFAKLELKVGTIKKVEEIEGADKLYKLSVDIGEKDKRTICAGIKEHYSKDELKGKQIIVICNLAPRKMRGIESQGMLLAAVSEDHKSVVLVSPEKKVDVGSKVS